jgi:hypothetical protein
MGPGGSGFPDGNPWGSDAAQNPTEQAQDSTVAPSPWEQPMASGEPHPAAQAADAPSQGSTQMIECKFCKHSVPKAETCAHCGNPLPVF